ncbi:universal stress protein [Streptomyces sp. NPDC006602]|uniref:universal stress protein n=1 Tax=Streptomyces sp. NPDC006602 TaxID=3364751 RepID=UPI0036786288
MSRTITVGLDGSPESLAAADWAAREAQLHAATLRVVHAGEQQLHTYVPFGGEAVPLPGADQSGRMLREVAASLAYRHPGLRIVADPVAGQPAAALVAAGRETELLVLGSRGLGRTEGLLLASVASAVVARARRPVVLVPAGGGVVDEPMADTSGAGSGTTSYRDVVLGLDLHEPDDAVLGFAFDAAARRAAALRVVHGRSRPASPASSVGNQETGLEDEPAARPRDRLADTLRPWREKFPGVEVTEEAVIGRAGTHLADASRNASLVVVGRKIRHASLGPHIGPVTHAVLAHAAAPVAVVPHD